MDVIFVIQHYHCEDRRDVASSRQGNTLVIVIMVR
jgi:hypothetical protein